MKHGVRLHLVNLYADPLGNATLPKKFASAQSARRRSKGGLIAALARKPERRKSQRLLRRRRADETDAAEVWIAGPQLCGRLLLRDELRKETRAVLNQLRKFGMRVVMLTGDRQTTVELIASQASVDDVRTQLSPEGKVNAVQQLKEADARVEMVGHGVNDAPCLAAADVGVAMGACGSDGDGASGSLAHE